ncbi:MAG TPA: hypothetical protein VFG04_29855 [Planctomycetaceae bacterium]|jgi:hypothetical protein|nr:hypothetical protein [Planctomycetaceae bacterium]
MLLNALLADVPMAWIRIAGLGSGDVIIGFLWLPLPVVLLGCAALWMLAAGPRANGPVAYDRYGRVVCQRRRRFWVVPVAICLIVLASRGLRDHVHGTITLDSDNHPATVVQRQRHHSDSSLEERLDRIGEHLDHVFGNGAAKLERQLDHGADQIDGQVERRAAQLQRQLEHVAAQIERHLDHVGNQISHKHPVIPHHAVAPALVVVTQTSEEPTVIEPNPPALPVVGPPQGEVAAVAAAPAAPPAISAPVTPVAPVAPPSPVANTAAPAAGPTAKTAATAEPASEKLPEWAKTEIVDEGTRKLVVVPGGFAGSEKEAEQEALEAARLVLGDAIQRAYPKVGHWLPPAAAIREDAVRRTFIEKIHRKTVSSGTPFIVYRGYQQIELSPAVFTQLLSSWKDQVLPARLEELGAIAALLTLTFATGAAYFRLDDRTHGRYRRRLAVGAVAVIGAGVAAAAALI